MDCEMIETGHQTSKPMWKLGLADFLVIFCMLAYLSRPMEKFAGDPGVGWHLKTGELIWQSGAIPRYDPFLFSASPRLWIADQWLSDVVLYLLYRLGSWPLVYAILTLVVAGTYMSVLYSAAGKHAGAWLASCFGVLAAMKLGQVHFILRPVVFGFFFFTISYLVTLNLNVILGSARNWSVQRAALLRAGSILCPLYLVWANMHPSFVLGFLVLILMFGGGAIDRWKDDGPVAIGWRLNKVIPGTLLLMACCLVSTFINPYSYHLHESILALGQSEYFMKLNNEWHSPDFKDTFGLVFEGTIALMVLSASLAGSRDLKLRSFDVLLLVVFAHGTLQAVRIMPYFGIIAAVPLTLSIINFSNFKPLAEWKWTIRIVEGFSRLEKRESRTSHGQIVLVAIAISVLFNAIHSKQLLIFSGPFGPPADSYPYKALELISRNLESASKDSPIVIASTPNWGGFITWMGYPRMRAVIDDRNTLLGEEAYRAFIENMRPGKKWAEYLTSVEADFLLVESSSAIGGALREFAGDKVVFSDELSVLVRVR